MTPETMVSSRPGEVGGSVTRRLPSEVEGSASRTIAPGAVPASGAPVSVGEGSIGSVWPASGGSDAIGGDRLGAGDGLAAATTGSGVGFGRGFGVGFGVGLGVARGVARGLGFGVGFGVGRGAVDVEPHLSANRTVHIFLPSGPL